MSIPNDSIASTGALENPLITTQTLPNPADPATSHAVATNKLSKGVLVKNIATTVATIALAILLAPHGFLLIAAATPLLLSHLADKFYFDKKLTALTTYVTNLASSNASLSLQLEITQDNLTAVNHELAETNLRAQTTSGEQRIHDSAQQATIAALHGRVEKLTQEKARLQESLALRIDAELEPQRLYNEENLLDEFVQELNKLQEIQKSAALELKAQADERKVFAKTEPSHRQIIESNEALELQGILDKAALSKAEAEATASKRLARLNRDIFSLEFREDQARRFIDNNQRDAFEAEFKSLFSLPSEIAKDLEKQHRNGRGTLIATWSNELRALRTQEIQERANANAADIANEEFRDLTNLLSEQETDLRKLLENEFSEQNEEILTRESARVTQRAIEEKEAAARSTLDADATNGKTAIAKEESAEREALIALSLKERALAEEKYLERRVFETLSGPETEFRELIQKSESDTRENLIAEKKFNSQKSKPTTEAAPVSNKRGWTQTIKSAAKVTGLSGAIGTAAYYAAPYVATGLGYGLIGFADLLASI